MAATDAKSVLRRSLLAERRSRPEAERVNAAAAICRLALAERWVGAATTVAAYESLPTEPGTGPLLDALRARKCRVLVPVVRADRDLDWRDDTGATTPPETLAAAHLVVVPALAVDHRGVRLGRGAGCYDRALLHARAGTPVVALLYDEEYVERLPAAEHDLRVTAVVTPSRVVHLGWTRKPA